MSCYSLRDPSRGTCINRLWRRAGQPILFRRSTQEPVLAKPYVINTQREDRDRISWIKRKYRNQGEIRGSGVSMHGYFVNYIRLQRERLTALGCLQRGPLFLRPLYSAVERFFSWRLDKKKGGKYTSKTRSSRFSWHTIGSTMINNNQMNVNRSYEQMNMNRFYRGVAAGVKLQY